MDSRVMTPGVGVNLPSAGSSALTLASIEWPSKSDVVLGKGQLLAAGHQELQAHQVEPGDHLCDGVFHL